MDWHEAYLSQARSEHVILRRLSDPEVEYCHRLHYLQMVAEKLAKAMLTPAGSSEPAPASHAVFVKMLQALKGRPEVRRQLRYRDARVFTNYINSLLDLAGRIERLSPDQAGFTQPNPEYPGWKDRSTGQAWAPVEYGFPEFDPRDPRMVKIQQLIGQLLRLSL